MLILYQIKNQLFLSFVSLRTPSPQSTKRTRFHIQPMHHLRHLHDQHRTVATALTILTVLTEPILPRNQTLLKVPLVTPSKHQGRLSYPG